MTEIKPLATKNQSARTENKSVGSQCRKLPAPFPQETSPLPMAPHPSGFWLLLLTSVLQFPSGPSAPCNALLPTSHCPSGPAQTPPFHGASPGVLCRSAVSDLWAPRLTGPCLCLLPGVFSACPPMSLTPRFQLLRPGPRSPSSPCVPHHRAVYSTLGRY